MTLKTLAWIAPETNEWDGGEKGKTWFVNVRFDDGESGSLGKKDSTQAEWLRQRLEKLIGTPAEFGLKDSGKKTNEGATKWYIESFPGYEPEPYKGGAKREFIPRYQDTAEGFASLQASMDRRTALMQAVAVQVGGFIGTGGVPALADTFYAWLRDTNVSPVPNAGERSEGAAAMGKGPAPSDTPSDGQAQEGFQPPPVAPSEDSPAAGTSDTPPSQDGPEVPGRGTSCLHLLGSETVKRSDGNNVEVCKKCRRVLEDVRI